MQTFKVSARVAHLREERDRVNNAATLKATFHRLKSLTADLSYLGADRATQWSRVKYTVNLAHAKSIFRFDCSSRECTGGDFDLSACLAEAVLARLPMVEGELVCAGFRSKGEKGRVPCGHVLRFKLTLAYTS